MVSSTPLRARGIAVALCLFGLIVTACTPSPGQYEEAWTYNIGNGYVRDGVHEPKHGELDIEIRIISNAKPLTIALQEVYWSSFRELCTKIGPYGFGGTFYPESNLLVGYDCSATSVVPGDSTFGNAVFFMGPEANGGNGKVNYLFPSQNAKHPHRTAGCTAFNVRSSGVVALACTAHLDNSSVADAQATELGHWMNNVYTYLGRPPMTLGVDANLTPSRSGMQQLNTITASNFTHTGTLPTGDDGRTIDYVYMATASFTYGGQRTESGESDHYKLIAGMAWR